MSQDRLRIGLLTHSVNPRGGVVHTLELAKAMSEEGAEVVVFAPAASGQAMFRDIGCPVVLAPVEPGPRDTVEMVSTRIAALRRVLADRDLDAFDLLHAQDSISGNALADLKEAGSIRRFVRTVHHLDVFDDPRLERWQRRAWADADHVLCVSETWVGRMRDAHGVGAQYVPNGVNVGRHRGVPAADVEAVRDRFGLRRGPVVLAVGGIEARKNTLALLEAFAHLRQSHPDAQLVIGGGASLLDHDAYQRRFVERAAELGFVPGTGADVVVTGPLDDTSIAALFHCADVVALVSLQEGFGLVVLEGLASGKAVVVSRMPPFTEYLDERVCLWADPHDPRSIATALGDALDGRKVPDFDAAVPELLSRFNWRASARHHLSLYRQWLRERSHAEPLL